MFLRFEFVWWWADSTVHRGKGWNRKACTWCGTVGTTGRWFEKPESAGEGTEAGGNKVEGR